MPVNYIQITQREDFLLIGAQIALVTHTASKRIPLFAMRSRLGVSMSEPS